MRSLLLLLMLFPLLELWLLIKVGAWLGALPTVALVVLSTLMGVAVLRRVGWQTVSQAQLRLRQRISPAPALIDGFALALAGVLLVLPGLLSDVAGLLLLIAPLRRWLFRRGGSLQSPQPSAAYAGQAAAGSRDAPVVIDGEYRRES